MSKVMCVLSHLSDRFHRADVSVWTEQNVLELSFLLINSLHRHLLRALFLHRLALP